MNDRQLRWFLPTHHSPWRKVFRFRRREASAGARGVGELKRIVCIKKLDEEEEFWVWVCSKTLHFEKQLSALITKLELPRTIICTYLLYLPTYLPTYLHISLFSFRSGSGLRESARIYSHEIWCFRQDGHSTLVKKSHATKYLWNRSEREMLASLPGKNQTEGNTSRLVQQQVSSFKFHCR